MPGYTRLDVRDETTCGRFLAPTAPQNQQAMASVAAAGRAAEDEGEESGGQEAPRLEKRPGGTAKRPGGHRAGVGEGTVLETGGQTVSALGRSHCGRSCADQGREAHQTGRTRDETRLRRGCAVEKTTIQRHTYVGVGQVQV